MNTVVSVNRTVSVALFIVIIMAATISEAQTCTDPESVEKAVALSHRALTEFRTGNYERALGLYDEVANVCPGAEAYWAVARCYDKLERTSEALTYYRKVVRSSLGKTLRNKAQKRIRDIKREMSRPVSVAFECDPVGTSVVAEGRVKGRCPCTLRLIPGKRSLAFVKKGYADQVRTFEIKTGPATNTFKVSMKPRPARFTIKTEPLGAKIHVDGEMQGYSPTEVSLFPGEHLITAVLDGYPDTWERVSVEPGGKGELRLVFGTEPQESVSEYPYRTYGYAAAGTAAAALIPAIVLNVLAQKNYEKVDSWVQWDPDTGTYVLDEGRASEANELETEADTWSTTAYVLYGISGALVVTSFVLALVKGPDSKPYANQTGAVSIDSLGAGTLPGGRGLGLTLTGRF